MIRLDLRERAERLARVRAEEVARAIGAKMAAALRGETDDEPLPTQAAFARAISSGLHTAPHGAPARTAFRPQRGILLAGDIASDLEALGGGDAALGSHQERRDAVHLPEWDDSTV